MAWYWVATLLFGTALGLMMLGVPVAIGFFVTNVIAAAFFMGGGPGIQQVINNGFGAMTNFALVPIPMFLLMGELFYHTGLAGRCFNAADKLLGNVRGRLAYVTLIGGTAYAGPAGSSMGACALLGRLIAKGTGEKLLDYARRVLFDPLGLGPVEWSTDAKGEPRAASGGRMRPPDLLRVGQMVLANGAWQGKQIVPADWLTQSTTPAVTIEGTRRYGWHWYLGELPVGTPRHVEPTISAIGWGGQRLFLVPALDLAVAMNAGNYRLPIMEQGRIGTTLILELVLPALYKHSTRSALGLGCVQTEDRKAVVVDIVASDRPIAGRGRHRDARSRCWTLFAAFQAARMAAIRPGLPTMFITRVRL